MNSKNCLQPFSCPKSDASVFHPYLDHIWILANTLSIPCFTIISYYGLFIYFFYSETVKCLLGGKRVQCMWIDTRADSERELLHHGHLNHLHGAFLPGSLWPIILICLVLSLYLVYLRILPCVYTSLSQDGFR